MMGVCLRRFCLNISVIGDILFCSEFGQGTTGWLWGECCFAVMYGEWYGVCDFVVLSGNQTSVFHLSRHFFAISKLFGGHPISRAVQGRGVLHHVCGMFCCQTVLTHGVFLRSIPISVCALLHVNPVRNSI